jgi:hypothetical protein
MRRLLLGLPLILIAAGCGGGGKNPATTPNPTPNDLPAYTQFPAYRAISAEDGNELFLQVRDNEGKFSGRYAFFIKNGGESVIDIMNGPVEGTVDGEGTIRMTLRNPYDETSEPIEIVGHRDGENLVMADAANPEDVETFEPIEPPTDTLTRDAVLTSFDINIEAQAGKFEAQKIRYNFFSAPVWWVPPTFVGTSFSESSEFLKNWPYENMITSWGNGWSEVRIGYDRAKFSGWVPQNPHAMGVGDGYFSSAELWLGGVNGKFHSVKATIKGRS